MFECDIAHRRSVAVLCMLYKIRCNPIHAPSSWCSTCVVCASAGYTRCSFRTSVYLLCGHRRSRASHYRTTFIPFFVSLLNDLADPVFDGVELAGFKSRANVFLLALAAPSMFVFYYFSISLLSAYRLVLWGWGLWPDRVYMNLF